MAEKLRVTVRPSGSHPDLLTVRDAMEQVHDIFTLLEKEADGAVAWRLSFASTNSPFTAEGEAVSRMPGIDISVMARAEKNELSQSLQELLSGRSPPIWAGTRKNEIAARILKRNQNGVGETDVLFDPASKPIVLTPTSIKRAVELYAKDIVLHPLLESDRSRKEHGSLEGEMLQVGTHYGEPAIRFKERKSKATIWCKVSKALQAEIAKQADFGDVWNHSRVIIRGTVEYNSDGSLDRVFAESMSRITPKPVVVDDLRDRDFTGGLNIATYLERFREGDLG